jgi:hypothetical protein
LEASSGRGADESPVELHLELEAIRARYALTTSHVFHRGMTGESGWQEAREELQQIVASEDFLGELDHLVRRVQARLGLSAADLAAGAGGRRPPPSLAERVRARRLAPRPAVALPRETVCEIWALLAQYFGHAVDCAAQTVERSCATLGETFNVCADCQAEMAVCAETSELACASCGTVRGLVGTVFDDAQFYNQEGQKAKSGSFNPNRHFRFWWDRILAREPETELGDKDDPDNLCGERLFAQLRAIIRRDRKLLLLLTVDDIRGMLKEVGRTDLNKNVPLILRRLTGVGPPSLSEAIGQRVEKLFSKAIEVGERVRAAGRTNRNYYPYYIYKILDSVLPPDSGGDAEAREARRVLYYIYMQGQDTLDKNDREWKVICAELPELEWRATVRRHAQKYRPLCP